NVTITGFTFDQPPFNHFGNSIFVDHVSGFDIRGNWLRNGSSQVDIVYSSGHLEGNLIAGSPNGPGALIAAGSTSFPAQVTVRANRSVHNGEHGLMAMATVYSRDADLGRNKLTALPVSLTKAEAHGLNVTVISNDFSQNGNLGLRLMII